MSPSIESWKKWQGQIVDGKLPLLQWLGGSEHAAAFLTTKASQPSKAVVKLVPADDRVTNPQLARWSAAAKLSHPHLIRLFDGGRCQFEDRQFLYVVMEFAEEDLSQILPLRPLSPAEVREMLRPAASALAYLHQADLAHGHIKPANIMAVDNQLKISGDGIGGAGEKEAGHRPGPFDAPELARSGKSAAADVWSLGAVIVAALTQRPPEVKGQQAIVPETLPQPFRDIARLCLHAEPAQRCSANDIVAKLQAAPPPARAVAQTEPKPSPPAASRRGNRPLVAAIALVAAVIALLAVRAVMTHHPEVPATQAETPSDTKAPAPFSPSVGKEQTDTRGAVLEQVLPNVSQSARDTVTGKIKVGVRVTVDENGQVTEAKLVSSGHSKYFDRLSLAAAQRWKFTPPRKDGQPIASRWNLRFQFSGTSTQAFPSEAR